MKLEERQEKVRVLADKIEKEIRSIIEVEPNSHYTNMKVDCSFCYQTYSRLNIRVVVDPYGWFDDGRHACFDCIEKNNLKLSDSELAIDFEARTIAITRILRSTTVELLDLNRLIED